VEARLTELLEREELLALLEHARSEGGRLVFLGGEAGVGKTSLVRAFCARTEGRILTGACENLATPSPLGPFADVADRTGGALAHALAGANARDAARAVLAELDRSTILVLEDVHWADEPVLEARYGWRRLPRPGRERRHGATIGRRAKRRSVEMAIVEADPNLGARIVADAKEHVLYSWSVQSKIEPIPVAGAQGRHFWDYEGKRYLDFASQLVNVSIGHQHPKIIQAIKDQADQLCTIGPPLASESRSTLGRMLAEVTPGDLSVSFFTNGGAEANENAVKLARLVTGRNKIVARYRSYHGATNGAVTLTGDPRRWAVEPGMPGVVRMLDPYTYRCPAGHPDPCPVCTGAAHLEEILQYEGPHTVAAVILETVTGTNGVIPPPDGYLRAIRDVCDRHGILLILDEVMAGFGRTGRWFACDHWDVVPDVLTVAKGINSGYVPLGAMIARGEIVDRIRDQFFPGGLTYAGHPLACASAIASIEAFREEGVVENAAAMGEWFGTELRALAERHPSIGDVRGLGCFWGLELVKNRETREMLVPFNASGDAAAPVARLAKAALERGLYLMTHWNVVMVVPPLTITPEEAEEGVAILDDVLALADEHYVG
jgi:taurine--2-oxoglutarate transaminase